MKFIKSDYKAEHAILGIFAALIGWAIIEPFAIGTDQVDTHHSLKVSTLTTSQ